MKKRIYILLAIQILGLIGLYAWHLSGLRGETYLLRTVPVDPRDLFRGDFVILRYEISSLPEDSGLKDLPYGSSVYVTLVPDGEFWKIGSVSAQKPEGDAPCLRARLEDHRLVYDIERYFVPEGHGNPPRPITVAVTITRSGRPMIKHVYADGQPWP